MTDQTISTTPKTIQEAASQLYHALIHDKRNDGGEFVKLTDGSPQWMTEVIHAAHNTLGHTLTPDDTVYEFIERCAGAIADSSEGDEQEAIYEMEPDVYTSELTAWLHASVDHVQYMTDALEEWGGDIDDGFKLLAIAQQKHIQEVANALLSALKNFISELPEDEESEEEIIDEAPRWLDFVAGLGSQRLFNYRNQFFMNPDFGDDLKVVDLDYWWWLDDNTYSRE